MTKRRRKGGFGGFGGRRRVRRVAKRAMGAATPLIAGGIYGVARGYAAGIVHGPVARAGLVQSAVADEVGLAVLCWALSSQRGMAGAVARAGLAHESVRISAYYLGTGRGPAGAPSDIYIM